MCPERTVLKWRATADEDGHYCFAVALSWSGLSFAPGGDATTSSDPGLGLAPGNVLPKRRSGDPAPLRRLSAGRRARREREPQGANNGHDGAELGISGLP